LYGRLLKFYQRDKNELIEICHLPINNLNELLAKLPRNWQCQSVSRLEILECLTGEERQWINISTDAAEIHNKGLKLFRFVTKLTEQEFSKRFPGWQDPQKTSFASLRQILMSISEEAKSAEEELRRKNPVLNLSPELQAKQALTLQFIQDYETHYRKKPTTYQVADFLVFHKKFVDWIFSSPRFVDYILYQSGKQISDFD
jgi:hypothetical protein